MGSFPFSAAGSSSYPFVRGRGRGLSAAIHLNCPLSALLTGSIRSSYSDPVFSLSPRQSENTYIHTGPTSNSRGGKTSESQGKKVIKSTMASLLSAYSCLAHASFQETHIQNTCYDEASHLSQPLDRRVCHFACTIFSDSNSGWRGWVG